MTSFDEISENMAFLDEWEDRYRYVIELGRELEDFPEDLKTPATKVEGCASQVWILPEICDQKLYFKGDSDAHIVKGLIAILHSLYSGQTLDSVRSIDAFAKMQELGLDAHLSAQRSNGLRAMVKRLQELAIEQAG
jgi:cysteine desulfuration protein SufE